VATISHINTIFFCPSCHQKRALLYGEWVEEIVLAPVAHRHYVFTVPRLLRPLFARRRAKVVWVRLLQSNDRSWPIAESQTETLPKASVH